MCDFGISGMFLIYYLCFVSFDFIVKCDAGYLVDSVAKTIDAGCKPYMAPERIDPSGKYFFHQRK